LREAAADACFLLKDDASVGEGGGRMRAEVFFESRSVLREDAGPPAIVPRPNRLESPPAEVGEATLDGGLGQAGELSDLGLGESMTGQPKDFHPPLDWRTGVVKAVVVDLFAFRRRELKGRHGFLPRGSFGRLNVIQIASCRKPQFQPREV
jgi:hypothetical protein